MNLKDATSIRRHNIPFKFTPTFVSFLVLFLVWGITSLSIDGFGTKEYVIQTLQAAAFLGIVAAGQTIVVMMAGIDLSVSGVVTLSSVMTSLMVGELFGSAGSIVLGILFGSVIGLINALGIIYLRMHPLIMSIAMLSLIEGFLLIYTNGTPPNGMSPAIIAFSNSTWFFGVPNVIFIWLLVSIFTYWLLHMSTFGRQIIALGTNQNASILSGVADKKVQIIGYVLCGTFAGLSGILQLGYIGSTYLTLGEPYQLMSIAAVVLGGVRILGGKGNYLGVIAGTLLIVILRNVLTVIDIPMAGRNLVMGLLILVILFAYARDQQKR